MSTVIAALFIILAGTYPPASTSHYSTLDADLGQAVHIACQVGTLHPDTVNCEETDDH